MTYGWVTTNQTNCTAEELKASFGNHFSVDTYSNLTRHINSLDIKFSKFWDEYLRKMHNKLLLGYLRVPYVYDALYAMAHALNATIRDLRDTGTNVETFLKHKLLPTLPKQYKMFFIYIYIYIYIFFYYYFFFIFFFLLNENISHYLVYALHNNVRKEESIFFNNAVNIFYSWFKWCWTYDEGPLSERGNPLLFLVNKWHLLYAPSHRQDSTYHGLCYTSRGALAEIRNNSVRPLNGIARGAMGCRINPSWWTYWAISNSIQCSMIGVTKTTVCAILSGMVHAPVPVLTQSRYSWQLNSC